MIHINNNKEYWLQTIPKSALDTQYFQEENILDYWVSLEPLQGEQIKLPPGKYQIHSDSNNITEEQAAELVETLPDIMCAWYRDYNNESNFFGSAIESFNSLINNKRIIILEKI
jgi:hypothetical protein